jgi:hypothetical protein
MRFSATSRGIRRRAAERIKNIADRSNIKDHQ